jgi:HEAT repeat protein
MTTQHPSSPKPKPPAVSHMIWFFIVPAAGFTIWAAFQLVQGLVLAKPKNLEDRLAEIDTARTAGDRWQAAYSVAQELQKLRVSNALQSLPEERREAVVSKLHDLIQKHPNDLRLKRYLLLTLGQLGERLSLPILEASLDDADAEIRFFAAWGFVDTLLKQPSEITASRVAKVQAMLSAKDSSLQKIASTFLSQVPNRPDLLNLVAKELSNPNVEVRWNAAVALGAARDSRSIPVLAEVFDLRLLRSLNMRSSQDLEQLVRGAKQAADKIEAPEIQQKIAQLRSEVSPSTPEGKAILRALE